MNNYMGKNIGNVMKFFMEFLKSRRNSKNDGKEDRAARNFQKRMREQKKGSFYVPFGQYILVRSLMGIFIFSIT